MPANPDTEQNQAVELAKSRAESRRANQENRAESESRAPKTEEAELLPQEYGMPLGAEGEEKESEEEGPEEEPMEDDEEEGPEDETSEEEMRRMAQMSESQMRQLKIQKAITIEEKNATKKLKKGEKDLKISKEVDITKNAVKIIRVIWGFALVYWWLLLIPIVLAFFVTIALGVMVWGCGFNLGSYSMNTKRLQEKFKNEKKMIIRRKNERTKKLQQSLKKM